MNKPGDVDKLPADLAEALSSLASLDDDALWLAARSRLAPEAGDQLEKLHRKRGQEGLQGAEARLLASLVGQYERTMLVRARAAALLKQRGHDVSGLLGAP